MQELRIITSLHRPLQKPLKSTKWVCQFVDENDKNGKVVRPSLFYIEFFFYLINKLNKEYKSTLTINNNLEGIPTQETIFDIYNYFSHYRNKDKEIQLKDILGRKREKGIETQIYSTYKAISYYINLTKDKFELLNDKYLLSENGKKLCKTRSSFFLIGANEKVIYFERILFCDIHAFISLCLMIKTFKKLKLSSQKILLFDFLKYYYKIPKFDYTTPSLKNYIEVRLYWIYLLDILDNNYNLRDKYITILNSNLNYKENYADISKNVSEYINNNFRKIQNYNSIKFRFINAYKTCLKIDLSETRYVNLYDIKEQFKMSYLKFNDFLNEFYEKEKNESSIFLSNIVSSIDKRKRFYIRNLPVLKIKISIK